jgi:hypothetical protein
MTTHDRDKIIAAAKEAGIFKRMTPVGTTEMFCYESNIERLYDIAFEAGRVAEREECAKVCEARTTMHKQNYGGYIGQHSTIAESKECAKSIRARSTE